MRFWKIAFSLMILGVVACLSVTGCEDGSSGEPGGVLTASDAPSPAYTVNRPGQTDTQETPAATSNAQQPEPTETQVSPPVVPPPAVNPPTPTEIPEPTTVITSGPTTTPEPTVTAEPNITTEPTSTPEPTESTAPTTSPVPTQTTPPDVDTVTFQDSNLEAVIRTAISVASGDITPTDLEGLTTLDASGQEIEFLNGIEYCSALTSLDLSDNDIEEILPLVQNAGLGTGDSVLLGYNPLNSAATGYISQLTDRGVNVTWGSL